MNEPWGDLPSDMTGIGLSLLSLVSGSDVSGQNHICGRLEGRLGCEKSIYSHPNSGAERRMGEGKYMTLRTQSYVSAYVVVSHYHCVAFILLILHMRSRQTSYPLLINIHLFPSPFTVVDRLPTRPFLDSAISKHSTLS